MKNKNKVIIGILIVVIIMQFLALIFLKSKDSNLQLAKTIQSSGEKMTDSSRITELENQIDGLNAEHTTYGQYIQTSKATIATAITKGGVSTSADATAATMAANIATLATNRYNAGISAGKVGTATASQVLQGKTFTNSSGVGISGTMANKGAWTSTPTGSGKVTIPAGYHNGSGYVNTATVYTNGYNAGYNNNNTNIRTIYTGQVPYNSNRQYTFTQDVEKCIIVVASTIDTSGASTSGGYVLSGTGALTQLVENNRRSEGGYSMSHSVAYLTNVKAGCVVQYGCSYYGTISVIGIK